ncbi:MAG: flagellar hook-basal body protein [Bacillota bacterium]
MIRGFYAGASCMVSQQTNLNTVANNIANVSTTGFKPQTTAFSALMYQNVNGGDGNYIQNGHGVRVQKNGINFTQGDLKSTGMPMDCAIVGDGFFAVENRDDGTLAYTRDGAFQLSVDESETYLVNGAGNYVLDAEGERITVSAVTTTTDTNGNVTTTGGFDPSDIGVYTFPNKYALELTGNNQYRETEASGEAAAVTSPAIKVGYLENSKVELAQEMVKMIEASKAFSLGSKVVQTADDMERVINQLR